MKKHIYLLILIPFVLAFASCNNSASKNDNSGDDQEKISILESIKKTSDAIKPNVYDSIIILNLDKESSSIEIEYVITNIDEFSIADRTHQIYFFSYLLYYNTTLWDYETITIVYYIEGDEINFHKYTVTEKTKSMLAEGFGSKTFDRLLKYSLSEFDVGTVYGLEFWLKNVNSRYPADTLNVNFFDLLETFSKECDNKIDSKNAKITIVILFVAIRDYIENAPDQSHIESSVKLKKILEDLWKICDDEMIEFAEHRLFGSVGDNW